VTAVLVVLAICAVVALVVAFGAVAIPGTWRDVRDAIRRRDERREADLRLKVASTQFAIQITKFGETLAEVLTPALKEAAVSIAAFGAAWSDWFEAQSAEVQDQIRRMAEVTEAAE
jgi:hypothetical protein